MTQQHMPQPDPDFADPGIPERRPRKRKRPWHWVVIVGIPAVLLAALLTYARYDAAHGAAAPQPRVTVYTTVTVTPKPVVPSRIVTLEDIITDCAYAMAKQGGIPLYTDRPKACAQLGEPEFQRASAIAIPLIMAKYDTPAP